MIAPCVSHQMDATVNTVTPGQFDVEGFPTLKFFRNGQATDYNGGRTESEIINWIRKKSGPAAKTITTVAEAESFKESAEVTVIGFFKNTDSADAKVCGYRVCHVAQHMRAIMIDVGMLSWL